MREPDASDEARKALLSSVSGKAKRSPELSPGATRSQRRGGSDRPRPLHARTPAPSG